MVKSNCHEMNIIIFKFYNKKKRKKKGMFGSSIQIQKTIFESNLLRVPPSFLLFGRILFLNSNSFTVQMILKFAKMRINKKMFLFFVFCSQYYYLI